MNLTEFRNKYSFYTCEDPAKISYDICVLCSGSIIMRTKIQNNEQRKEFLHSKLCLIK